MSATVEALFTRVAAAAVLTAAWSDAFSIAAELAHEAVVAARTAVLGVAVELDAASCAGGVGLITDAGPFLATFELATTLAAFAAVQGIVEHVAAAPRTALLFLGALCAAAAAVLLVGGEAGAGAVAAVLGGVAGLAAGPAVLGISGDVDAASLAVVGQLGGTATQIVETDHVRVWAHAAPRPAVFSAALHTLVFLPDDAAVGPFFAELGSSTQAGLARLQTGAEQTVLSWRIGTAVGVGLDTEGPFGAGLLTAAALAVDAHFAFAALHAAAPAIEGIFLQIQADEVIEGGLCERAWGVGAALLGRHTEALPAATHGVEAVVVAERVAGAAVLFVAEQIDAALVAAGLRTGGAGAAPVEAELSLGAGVAAASAVLGVVGEVDADTVAAGLGATEGAGVAELEVLVLVELVELGISLVELWELAGFEVGG